MPDVGELVRQLGTGPPFRLLDVARGYLAEAQVVEAVNLLLVDYGQAARPTGLSSSHKPTHALSRSG